MVHFTQCCSRALYIHAFGWYHRWYRITPFGNPGVNGYVLLSPAYRSLSRPSSPYSSQASAIDLYSLDHIIISAFLHLPQFAAFLFKLAVLPARTYKSVLLSNKNLPVLVSVPSFVISKNIPNCQKDPETSSGWHIGYGTDKSWTCDPRLIRAVL